jgi:hypothetical protein
MNRKDSMEEKERLEQLAVKEKSGIEDYEEVKERVEGLTEEASEDAQEEQNDSYVSGETPEDANQDTDIADTDAAPTDENAENADSADSVEEVAVTTLPAEGISCWGDDLINGTDSDTYSYMNVLARLLQENGYNIPVVNKTLQGGGTLSMMKMAGVADEDLQNYITAHQQAANGAALNVTETGIRDLTEEQTDRSDAGYIPVIFMGYYGGWNHDANELAEQQERIIDTFTDNTRYIVVGTRPVDGSVDTATLDSVMTEKWGEHYISLASVTASPASTYDAQAAMAQAILDKLVELGYISK